MNGFPCLLACLAICSSSPAAQIGQRFPVARYAHIGKPYEFWFHDWTDDGHPDLVALDYSGDEVTLTRGVGDGTLDSLSVTLASVGAPWGMKTGHLDAGTTLDFCLLDTESFQVVAFLADRAGGFRVIRSLATAAPNVYVEDLAIVDFDRDGWADLAVVVRLRDSRAAGWIELLAGDGSGSFRQTGLSHAVDSLPRDIVAGDFDEDGTLDLLVSNNGANTLSVLLGNGSGFQPARSVAGGQAPWTLVVADFDRDGHLDVAIGESTSTPLLVKYGDGLGGFSRPQRFGGYRDNRAIVAGDWNGDGWIDLASGGGPPACFLNDGRGGFRIERLSSLAQGWSVGASDLDGDGRLDLAGSSWLGFGVILGDGSGRFGVPRSFDDEGANGAQMTRWLESADLDGDGEHELISGGHEIHVRSSDGAGGFGAPRVHALALSARDGKFADFDQDGSLDLATVGEQSWPVLRDLELLRGDGAGGLGLPTVFPLQDQPLTLETGDLDADGAVDVAVVLEDSDRVETLYGDGHGGLEAGQAVPVGGLGPTDVTPVDVDRDGDLDLAVPLSGRGWTVGTEIGVLLNDGARGWQAPTQVTLGEAQPQSLQVADLNHDGVQDLVCRNAFSLSFLAGLPAGGFAAPLSYAVLEPSIGFTPSFQVALEDIDGDGEQDAVMSGMEIRLGRNGEFQRAGLFAGPGDFVVRDWDGDGFCDVVALYDRSLTVHLNRALTPAGLEPFGTGTPGCGGTHLALADQSPRIGTRVELVCSRAPLEARGLVLVSRARAPAGSVKSGVLLHADPASPILTRVVASDIAGRASLSTAIPHMPQLVGESLFVQWFWNWPRESCQPSDSGWSSSRGLEVTVQPRAPR